MMIMNSLASQSLSPSLVSSLSTNPALVGSAWIVSSSLFSTFYTTSFLKHRDNADAFNSDGNDFELRQQKENVKMTRCPVSRLSYAMSNIPRPMLLTLYRFIGSFLIGIFANVNIFGVRGRIEKTLQLAKDFLLPTVCLFTANFFNTIALDRIGISLTYICKCAIPLVTVLFTLLNYGTNALPNSRALISLIPITLGIAIVAWDSPIFELRGFIAAMISCTAQTALNITSKGVIHKHHVDGIQAQRCMSAVASIIAIVVTSSSVLSTFSNNKSVPSKAKIQNLSDSDLQHKRHGTHLALGAVTAYHVEYMLSFMFVSLVEPITFAIGDAFRRLSTIVSGQCMFKGTPFTRNNITGMACALLGFLSYSVAMSQP